jgi:hypothetical protein
VEPSQFLRRQQSTLTPMGVWSAAGSRWRPSSGEPEIVLGRFNLLPSGAAPVAVGLLSKWATVLLHSQFRVTWVATDFRERKPSMVVRRSRRHSQATKAGLLSM